MDAELFICDLPYLILQLIKLIVVYNHFEGFQIAPRACVRSLIAKSFMAQAVSIALHTFSRHTSSRAQTFLIKVSQDQFRIV